MPGGGNGLFPRDFCFDFLLLAFNSSVGLIKSIYEQLINICNGRLGGFFKATVFE